MAVPVALSALVASFGLATVAVISTVDVQQGSHRDQSTKSAIAAADAGASVALMRLNRYQTSLTEATPCVGPSGEAQAAAAGWCPATTAASVGGATYSYQFSAYKKGSELTLVSTGTAGTVGRRVKLGLNSVNGTNVFANERMIGEEGIEVDGNVTIKTDIGTNGNVTQSGGSGTICGDVRHGNGKTAPKPSCEGEITEGNRVLPDVNPPTTIATINSNCRLVPNCTNPKEVDTYSKNRSSTVPWDSAKRILTLSANASLTLGGSDYWVCKLDLQNGELIMAAGSKVRIFVDTPEHCGFSAGETQVGITGNATIKATGYDPSKGNFEVPGIYVMGSSTISTNVVLTGGSSQQANELVLYAPNSAIEIGGNSTWLGMIAGKSIYMHGTPAMESNAGMTPPEISLQGLWERSHYVECTGAGVSPPNAYC